VPREQRQLRFIERVIGQRITPMRLPTLADVAARRLELLKEGVRTTLAAGGLDEYLLAVEDLSEEFDISEVAAAAMKLMAERDGVRPATVADATDAGPTERGMTRIFVEIGRKQSVRPGDIVGAIANEARLPGNSVGAIDIYDQFTFVEVEQQNAQRIIDALNQSTIRGVRIKASIARPK